MVTTGVTLCVVQALLSVCWSGFAGEAAQHAWFIGEGQITAEDRELWEGAARCRGLTYLLSLVTTALLIGTTLHVYYASPRRPAVLPWAAVGVVYFVASLTLMAVELAPSVVPTAAADPSSSSGGDTSGIFPTPFIRGGSFDRSAVPPLVVVAVSICSVLTNVLTFIWNGCAQMIDTPIIMRACDDGTTEPQRARHHRLLLARAALCYSIQQREHPAQSAQKEAPSSRCKPGSYGFAYEYQTVHLPPLFLVSSPVPAIEQVHFHHRAATGGGGAGVGGVERVLLRLLSGG